ncbi:hypothetical protein [Flammeovirga sp. EKP202]|uniref:hypothetical protein n=1 Tax=Flammeovirga sp. EKP202 TaxID=2770592 RepID=UPI00165F987D|nr:hypothetical protein [Flammeovirga sp. EKP202]MBD0404783.1 hypothetical protein [Flammeovirga sp. EKP202]
MATITKIKIGIIVFTLSIILSIKLIANNFYKPHIINDWKQLEWSNFQGIPKPFSIYTAAIVSDIKLVEDSTSEHKFYAKAFQNETLSWLNKNDTTSENSAYILKHEQYHFNITEIFARNLNQALYKDLPLSESEIIDSFKVHRAKLIMEQEKYDKETDHGLIISQQKYWEYKIDSVLFRQTISMQEGLKGPLFEDYEVLSDDDFKNYRYYKYNMGFKLGIQYLGEADWDIDDKIITFLSSDNIEIHYLDRETQANSQFGIHSIYVMKKQQTKYNFHSIRIDDIVYSIITTYPYSSDSTGYERISKSFLNSITIHGKPLIN